MATKTKIKIVDNSDLRAEHILTLADNEEFDKNTIENGFRINELWQIGNATVYEIRQAGFKIHEVARQCKTETTKSAIRACGQAVGVGHMREHAMICSDYAIKTIQLAFPDQMDKILQERKWQLNELKQHK